MMNKKTNTQKDSECAKAKEVENIMYELPDSESEKVAGGGYHFDGKIVAEMVTTNRSTYSSGSAPKFSVGQQVKINYLISDDKDNYYPCDCEILEVSKSASYGLIWEEYGYKVKILAVLPEVIDRVGNSEVGKIYSGVYESCLFVS